MAALDIGKNRSATFDKMWVIVMENMKTILNLRHAGPLSRRRLLGQTIVIPVKIIPVITAWFTPVYKNTQNME